ncbi:MULTISPECIES: hypothetical protein [Pontibacillus]|uniref:SbsA Ig-like domain-containing protein n=1 Tax=Pontibacillus chungwhensis TaxID=265426 RepID=A0ABY8UWH5_9BACI|nr:MULTISPECIES: hypothetical protein [Pontibacillus]MCD5324109.1 hypothetical protein [Pontibacillus sp. HN14]WIF97834.1 hypothetical protein QNI29_19235 [Pontibacillus chungwhensis]
MLLRLSAINATTIEVTFSNGVTEEFTVDELTPDVENEVTVTYEDEEYTVTVDDYSPEPQVEDVSAKSSKSLHVTFNKPVDETKANLSVKKGAVTASISSVDFNEDMTEATIELGSKLTAGTYTVNVSGVTDEVLTGSVEVKDEMVDSIEILSEVAPLTDGSDADALVDDATVGYKVYNQYGEDITKYTAVTATASTGSATVDSVNSQINLDGSYEQDDKVTLTIVHGGTATTATQTLTVSSQAKAADVEIGSLYNEDGKALNEDTDLSSDEFYLPVQVEDQYGNAITNVSQLNSDILINETNTTVVDFASNFTTVEIDGEDVPALKVNAPAGGVKVGTSTLTLISKTTGDSASVKVEVSEATRTNEVAISQPALVVAGEKALLPAQVLDKEGNLVADVDILNDSVKGVDVTVGNTTLANPFVEKDGDIYVEVPASELSTTGAVAVVAVTSSNKVNTTTLNVRETAEPVVITGLNSDFSKTLKASATTTITTADLNVQDQYGRTMDEDTLDAWLDADAANKIVVTEDESSSIVSISDVAGDNEITASGESVTVTAGTTNGEEELTMQLEDTNGVIQGSAAESTLRVTDGTEYESYSVEAVGTVYDENGAGQTDADAYDEDVKVYGVLNDGSKVQLTAGTDFTAKSTNSALSSDVADGTIDANGMSISYATDATTKELPMTVTINATGEQFTQNVTFSKETPEVDSLKVTEDTALNADSVSSVAYDIDADGNDFNVAQLTTGNPSDYNVIVTDQYGVDVLANATTGAVTFPDSTTAAAPSVTITPVKGEININNNGLTNATVTDASLSAGEEFNVTLTYDSGASETVKVVAE